MLKSVLYRHARPGKWLSLYYIGTQGPESGSHNKNNLANRSLHAINPVESLT